MYLITVARAVEAGHPEPVPMPLIAEGLSISVASANEMVRKLATRGLLTYEPYHGAELTGTGWAVASRVLRTRRLWATFLADHLGFGPTEADDQACHLEHVTAHDAAERLAVFLGDPESDPLGRPIPAMDSPAADRAAIDTLDTVPVGCDVEVASIRATGAANAFLTGEGIAVGTRISVIGTGESGVLVDGDHPLNVTRQLASLIEVRVMGRTDAR